MQSLESMLKEFNEREELDWSKLSSYERVTYDQKLALQERGVKVDTKKIVRKEATMLIRLSGPAKATTSQVEYIKSFDTEVPDGLTKVQAKVLISELVTRASELEALANESKEYFSWKIKPGEVYTTNEGSVILNPTKNTINIKVLKQ